jgi:MFS family permease
MTLSPWAPEYRRLSAGIVSLVAVFGFEGIAVSAVMPVAAADLNAISNYAVAFTSFTMASLLGVTFAGLWADHIGVKKIVTLAILILGIGSLIAGFAPNIQVLTLGRSVQGFALGIDLVTMYVVIGRMYPDALRPKALGMLAAAWVVPGLVGPGIAGLMVEVSSWRMTFWIVPLLLILPSVVLLSQLDKLQTVIPQPRNDSKNQIIAVLAAVLALAVFQFSTSRIGQWNVSIVIAISAACLIATAWTTRTLMPKGYLKIAVGIPAIIGMRGVISAGYFAAEVYVPLALQEIRDVSVAISGAVLTVSAVTWFGGSWLQGSHRIKMSREKVLVFGTALISIGIFLTPLAVFAPSNTTVASLAASLACGAAAFGMGICFPTLGGLMLDKAPVADHARHSASLQMSDSFGTIVITSITGAALSLAAFKNNLSSQTFVEMWLVCGFVSVLALLFIPQIQGKRAIRP